MKLFADHCFFQCAIELLREAGYEIIKAKEAGLEKADDNKIASFCKKESLILLTLDNDFNSLYRFPLGSHCGIVVFRIHPFTPENLTSIISGLIEKKLFAEFKDALVIIKRNKIRIIRAGRSKETI